MEVEQLRRRLTDLEQQRTGSAARRGRALMVVALAVLGSAGVALASTPCANGIPFCFAPDEPALASEMNTNFAALKTWLEAKVGPTGPLATPSTSITTTSLNATSLNATSLSATSLSAASALLGSATVTGALTVGGDLIGPGYELACAAGEPSVLSPFCCRLDVRTGAATCKVATISAGAPSSWAAAVTLFSSAPTAGRFSLSCAKYVAGLNYPLCCRIDNITQAVACKVSPQTTALAWVDTVAPTF